MAVRSEIIVCEKRFDIDHPVVTFEDDNGFSAYVPHRTDNIGEIYAFDPAPGLEKRASRYRARRLLGKTRTLARLKQVVRQFVIHLDGCRDAKMCFNVLHNQRGLSAHFLVDTDGVIYQTLDLADCAFHAGGVNEISVGAEIQNRGDAARSPNYYPEGRPTVTCRVHGQQFLAYDYTPVQYEAMIKLGRVLSRILDLPLASPQAASGDLIWTVIPDPRKFAGWVGHYHVEYEKWDPGPWDFRRFFRGIGSRVTFPMTAMPKDDNDKEDAQKFALEGDRYFDNSEQDARAHFPVGPLGHSRLWHGGLHLVAKASSPLYSPFRGQVVAARMGSPCPVGSCNFILLKHKLFSGKASLLFYSLYFHVEVEEDNAMVSEIVPWVSRTQGRPARRALEQGKIALLAEEVEAGELIGHVGEAGPADERTAQIHFEIFSTTELGQKLDPGYWDLIDGGTSRFCSDPSMLERIDRPESGKPRDGLLSRREIRDFFQFNPRREELRRIVVRHRSEWTGDDWEQELSRAPDFASLPADQRQRLLAQQVTPTIWWTSAVASHAGLPMDGMVYSYHPIGFILWFKTLSQKTAGLRAEGIEGADKWEGKMAPTNFTVDAESAKGMTDEEDYYSGESGKNLTLEDLANGYPDE